MNLEQDREERVEALIDNIVVRSTLPDEKHSAENSYERLMARSRNAGAADKAGRRRIIRYRILLVAASVALLIAVGGLFLMNSSAEDVQYIVAANSTRDVMDIDLPDGTTVKLNARSKLTYPETFSGKRREVFLDGEGYFEVVHDSRHPFVVRAGELSIQVLGTKFNVNARSLYSGITTTLLEGSVDVASESGHVLMKPGQQLFYNTENKEMQLSVLADADSSIDWTRNIWTLSKTPLMEICHRLEYIYDVHFVVMNDNLLEKSYTGQFDSDESLESVLKTIVTSTPFEYEIVGKNIIIR